MPENAKYRKARRETIARARRSVNPEVGMTKIEARKCKVEGWEASPAEFRGNKLTRPHVKP
jgi:hypothetical protein